MKNALTAVVILLSFFLITEITYCQLPGSTEATQQDSLFQIETTDGNQYLGVITFQDSSIIKLKTEKLGEVSLYRKDIVKITEVTPEKIVDGKFWSDNPQATRYMWAPNGYGLKKGEGYYQNIWVMFNQVSVGFSDNFSMGVGVMPTFLFGTTATPVWVTPKISVAVSKNLHIGVGALALTALGTDEMGITGLLYGTATIGSIDKNISIGTGYGFVDGELADVPTFNLSGMIRTGEKWYFMTENYFLSSGIFSSNGESEILTIIGGRRMLGKASIDFGIFRSTEMTGMIGLPWVGFTIPFGA